MSGSLPKAGLGTLLGILFLQLCALCPAALAQCNATAAGNTPVQLFMPDGQLISSPLRVFVNVDLPDYPAGKEPVLTLFGGHAVTSVIDGEQDLRKPIDVVRHQSWFTTIDDQKVSFCGTLLLFAIRGDAIIEGWKPMRRLLPVLQWHAAEGGAPGKAATLRPVNVGNAPAAWALTLLVTAAIVVLVALLGRRRANERLPGAPFCLLCADDGHLSLSKVQVAAWTIAIAMVVLFYGLVRFDVPSIPAQLIALMGLSLATGGISYLAPPAPSAVPALPQASPSPPSLPPFPPPASPVRPGLADLVRNFPQGKPPELSLSRAQMVVWTVVVLILFVAKSALDGAFWAVPWELVTLTGLSQAGYLTPKFRSAV